MKKIKKLKVGILIIGLVFTLLYFSIQFGNMNLSINDEGSENKNITPILSNGKSVLYEWNRTWSGNSDYVGNGVAVDSLGNVYLVGDAGSFGNVDMGLVKYNRKGEQQWNRTWGGTDSDYGYGVAVDSSNNIYLAGSTYSFGAGYFDMILVKYNRKGEQQWNQTWGGANWDYGSGVAVDSSDNVYLTGYTHSFGAGSDDMILVKYDSSGVLQWNRTWGGADNDVGEGVAVDSSDNVYLTGYTENFGAGEGDIVLVKYNGNGMLQWNRTWGGADNDVGEGVAVDSSDNVYLTGYTHSFGAGYFDMILVKYDENGMLQWNRTWGGGGYDSGRGVAVDSSDKVYLTGYTRSFGAGYTDMVLVKYDGLGVQLWNLTWGGVFYDGGEGVAVDSSSNIYLAGFTMNFVTGYDDMVLVKFANVEKPSSDEVIMNLIIVVSIVSTVGVGIALTYVIRKRRKIVE